MDSYYDIQIFKAESRGVFKFYGYSLVELLYLFFAMMNSFHQDILGVELNVKDLHNKPMKYMYVAPWGKCNLKYLLWKFDLMKEFP